MKNSSTHTISSKPWRLVPPLNATNENPMQNHSKEKGKKRIKH